MTPMTLVRDENRTRTPDKGCPGVQMGEIVTDRA